MAVTPKVLLKRSSVVGRVPSASDLQYGEIAINFVDGKIYYKDASNNVKAFIDSARVQAIAANEAGNFLDSAEAVALIDSAYVQLKQSYDYNSLSNKPNILDSADVLALAYDSGETQTLIFSLIDSSYIRSIQSYDADTLDGQDGTYYLDWTNVTNKPDLIDSALTLQLIDSSYIKNTIDSSYINLNVNQTTIENIIDATYINNNIDSAHIQSIINQDYITNTIDSSVIIRIVNENVIDSSDVIDLIDSDYLRNRVRQLISSVDQGGDGSFSYNQYTGVMTYTGPSAAEVRAHLVAGAGVTYDSATGVITGYTGFDSDFAQKTTDDLTEGSNLYYTDARVTAHVDSAYVQARQDYAYGSLTGTPYIPTFGNDYVDSQTILDIITREGLDSDLVISLVDSAYIALRDRFQDSSLVTSTVDATYVQARQIQYNTSNFTDSAFVTNLPVSTFTNDAGYLTAATADGLDSNLVTQLIDSAYVNLRADHYTSFNTDFAAKSTSDLTEGSNLYYTKARADSDIASSLSDSGNTVNVTINNTIEDKVDSAYVLARVAEAPFLNSADAVNLIDSAYIQARQVDLQRDSGFITNIIDSAYVAARSAAGGIDSAGVLSLIDSDYIELRRPAETIFNIVNNGASAYTFTGDGFSSGRDNPTIYLIRGKTYKFNIAASGHPFQIRVSNGGSAYNTGVTNNGAQTGDILFTPDMNAPSSLVYQCTNHGGMVGNIVILDDTTGGLDSASIIQLIDSAYVQAREAAGGGGGGSLDSGNIDTIVDSAYIKFRVDYDTDESLQFGKDQYALGTLTGSTSGTNIYTAFNPGQADGLFTSAYNYADGGVDIDQWVWGYYWVNSGLGYAQIATKADNGDGTYTYTTSPALSWAGGWTNYVVLADRPGGKDTPLKIRYNGASDAVEFNAKKQIRIYHSDESDRPLWINASYLDLNGSPAYFSNKFDSNSLFPSATDYPGMFATFDSNITNGPGGAYVSLEGQWTKISGSGVDSGEAKKIVLDVIDSDHFIPGKGERNWNITSAAPPEISTGDFWLDRDDLVLSKLTADNNWTSTLPSGSFSAEPGLTSTNWFTNSPGGSAASFNVSGGPVGSFEKTFVMGTSPYNSGGRYTFSSPVAFSYFSIGNTASGHIYSVGYTDGSYMVSNTGISGSKTATPSSYTWYNYDNTSMGYTVGNGSGLINLTHPNGALAEYIIIGRNNYGTRNYNAWMFFAGGNTWQRVGEIYDSSDIKNLIDSAYINSKVTGGGGGAGGGLDSAAVLSLIDSNYIAAATGGGATISQTHFHFTADSGQTIFSGADDDSATLSYTANGIMVFLNGILLIDSVDYTAIDGSTVTLLDSASLSDTISIVKMSGSTSTGTDSAAVISLIDSNYVRQRVTKSDLDMEGNKVLFANVYDSIGALPSATTYHGMFAHVHATGAGYFAHAGNWTRLANQSEVSSYDSTNTIGIIDSAYVQARQTSGGGGTVDSADIIAIVDSAYVQARQTSGGGGGGIDSAAVITLIDSDYIGSKVDFTRGEFVNEKSQYTATAAQTVFNHSSIDPTHLDVYINGVLQVVNDDYTANTSAVTFTAGVDSGYSVTIVEKRGRVATQRGLVESKYYFTTPTPITAITGTDDNGITLDYSDGFLDVYLNGILLKDSDDYSTNAGTTVTLVSATDSNDLVTLINRKGIVVTPNVKNYEFTATAGQTTFSGADINGNTLAYVPGAAQVFLNGIILRNVDYTGITGTSIVLVDSASLNDELVVSAFSNPGQNMDLYKFTADSGQTIFSGNDLSNASLAYQPGNIQVFMNGLLLNDSDDYTASNGMSVVLTDGADASDEIKIASFVSNTDVIRTNAWTAPSGTPVTATAGDKLFIDTSSAKTITLPSSASMGDEIRIIDVTGNAATNNITVARNGHKIQGGTTDLTINVDRAGIGLVYYNSAQGWVLIEN